MQCSQCDKPATHHHAEHGEYVRYCGDCAPEITAVMPETSHA